MKQKKISLHLEEYHNYGDVREIGIHEKTHCHVLFNGRVAKVPERIAKHINNFHLGLSKKYCLIYEKTYYAEER